MTIDCPLMSSNGHSMPHLCDLWNAVTNNYAPLCCHVPMLLATNYSQNDAGKPLLIFN